MLATQAQIKREKPKMAWLAEAHADWHVVNGRYAVCPLDCGVAEALYAEADNEDSHRIRCAQCKGVHETVAEVKVCSTV